MTAPASFAADLASVCAQFGATLGQLPGPDHAYHLRAPRVGLGCYVTTPAREGQPYVLAWYVLNACKMRLSLSFANVNRYHQRRATWTCFGDRSVLAMLEHGLKKAAAGTAFEPDHRSLINVNTTAS